MNAMTLIDCILLFMTGSTVGLILASIFFVRAERRYEEQTLANWKDGRKYGFHQCWQELNGKPVGGRSVNGASVRRNNHTTF
jgi:hypothetical protein